MMKVCVVTCYESNEERVSFVLEAFKKRKDEVIGYTSNFSHIRKEKRKEFPFGLIPIKTKTYKRNLSLARLISHSKFAKDAFKSIEKDNPDLVYVVAPCNSLIKEARKYKDKYLDKKIIIDMIDMWPESLPLRINKKIFPFNIWRNVRTNNINCADNLITECDYYQNILKQEYFNKITTIHWARDRKTNYKHVNILGNKLVLCYIGSINNIIDVNIIKNIIINCDKQVELHVIGEGENTNSFINELNKVCKVIYHGAIRNEKEKARIFNSCHAGINIYKEGLYIGLTVKCIDYFCNGLPIINNIKGDTYDFVEKYNVGINVDKHTKINSANLIRMRNNNQNIINLYNRYFTKEVFIKKLNKVIDGVIK